MGYILKKDLRRFEGKIKFPLLEGIVVIKGNIVFQTNIYCLILTMKVHSPDPLQSPEYPPSACTPSCALCCCSSQRKPFSPAHET